MNESELFELVTGKTLEWAGWADVPTPEQFNQLVFTLSADDEAWDAFRGYINRARTEHAAAMNESA